VQRELDRLAPWIAEAEARYGFPDRDETRTALAASEEADASVTKTASLPAQAVLPARLASAPILLAQAAPVAGVGGGGAGGGSIEIGRNLFNTNCSHCHGPDAASPDARIDLRRLSRRYHEDKDQVFDETVRKGRPDKGMPTWAGVLAESDIQQIKAYIDSVQMK
jgi:mono/diheme cytochrome c family protein